MATASSVEIKRAEDQRRAAEELAQIRAELQEIKALLAALSAPKKRTSQESS